MIVHQNTENAKQAIAIVEQIDDRAKYGIESMKQMELSIDAVSEIEKVTQNVSANAEESVTSVEGSSLQANELNNMIQDLGKFVGLKERKQ